MEFNFQSRRSNVFAMRGMVATSQPLAAQAGLEVLRLGGNAADAAIAAAAMMAVVEPVSCGLGGDCFVLYFDAGSGAVTALNGSGRAAAGADPAALRRAGYRAMPRATGAAVTVPGAVMAWHDLMARHGTMPWGELLKPAVATAEGGFPVTEWIAQGWKLSEGKLRRDRGWPTPDLDPGKPQPSGHELLVEGRAPRVGEVMRLPTLARTLRGIADQGPAFLYRGEFARVCAAHVQAYGGWLTEADLAAHQSTWDEPLTCQYRGVTLYECPPNGQGLAAILACNLARGFDLAGAAEADRVHWCIECMRLAFADAQRWVFDPARGTIPLRELCSAGYADRRRLLIDPLRAAQDVRFGEPRGGSDTIYLAVVDGAGNACSLIQSNYMGVGTGLVVPGFGVSLQNRGAGFDLHEGSPNELAGGRRPYHTIIPAMTTRDGALHACFGVMGGTMQPQGHFQMLVNMLDLGLLPQQALDAPRWQLSGPEFGLGLGDKGGLVLVEEGISPAVLAELARRGHRLQVMEGFQRIHMGGGQIITRDPATGVLCGGSDPRKDGCAVGI
ncbi:MAG: gamma-glutamyltransferase family protein [Planctomycetes bacterium]|nr:gamma-glutamyltransferase family protein [Planctomycetota bacterium]MCL4730520.1 gamma-glutamyltransferase family protein [Planctomycetota bacterium]